MAPKFTDNIFLLSPFLGVEGGGGVLSPSVGLTIVNIRAQNIWYAWANPYTDYFG